MARVLGISAHYHDAAAALVVDGRLEAAMQEERFSRIKNDPSLPIQAARSCLRVAGLGPRDLDAIVFYENPFAKLERVLTWLLRTFPRSIRQFPRAIAEQLGNKLWVLDRIAEELGAPRAKVTTADHHECHAASAFFTSPYDNAAVLTVDGVGEATTTAIWRGEGNTLREVAHLEFPHSLGLLYGALTSFLGFEVNEGEYKVMGLAAFGEPRFEEEFRSLLRQHDDGTFELGLRYFDYGADAELGFSHHMEALLGERRAPGRPWNIDGEPRDRHYADIAATLQVVTERALLGLAAHAKRATGAASLCLAGGVALNAVANARIARDAGFERVFVHPAAGDAGGAVGAAIVGALRAGDARPGALTTAALGEGLDVARARETAEALGLVWRRVDDPAAALAERLDRDEIVALCTGRFEWGPRALGQRSILAAPRHGEVRERINRVIKRREPFRPFAPAVLAASAGEYFEGAPNDMTPFMTTVCDVKPNARERLHAVTHVDGSARVQTVTPESVPRLAEVLSRLAAAGHDPIVLNTSLNGPGEPIVASELDALAFFAAHPIDAMLIEDVLLTRGGS